MQTWKSPWQLLLLAILLLGSLSCGGTWVDDDGTFNRVFGFSKPQEVDVLHSYYWKSRHWSTEYSYFIALKAPPKFTTGVTSAELMVSVEPGTTVLSSCGDKPPQWFLPKSLTNYEAWVPRAGVGYRVFRDKSDGTLFLCGQRL